MTLTHRLRAFLLARRIRRMMARREYYRSIRTEVERLMAECSEQEWTARQQLIQLRHRSQLARLGGAK